MIELLKRALFEGYSAHIISFATIIICLSINLLIVVYIHLLYMLINKNSFYNKSFNLSLIVVSIVTASIILTIQSNIVVSLGMVGALSIVRFRTAIKDPMDLAFLFWSISVGIICGAGFALIAIISSIFVTILILLFEKKVVKKGSVLLVVDADAYDKEKEIIKIVENNSTTYSVRARNANKTGLNIAIELKSDDQSALLMNLLSQEFISNASIVEHDGNITA